MYTDGKLADSIDTAASYIQIMREKDTDDSNVNEISCFHY